MITLRKLRFEDKDQVFKWRNLPGVAKYMYTDHRISPEEHEKWFNTALSDATRVYWIIIRDGQDVGLVNLYNLDRKNQRSHWAFYIASPDVRGSGIGSFVEYSMLQYAFDELHLNKLCCEVLVSNEAVIAMHKKFGFQQEGYFSEHISKGNVLEDIACLAIKRSEWEKIKMDIESRLKQKGLL